MSARPWRLAWLAGLFVGLSSLPAVAETPPARKTVLTIYSQARESAAISVFDQSLRKTLQSTSGGAATSYAEFMDIQRFSDDGFVQAFRDYLSQKYQGQQVDALMLIGPAAARAVFDRKPLFPGVPMVFYTIDRSDMAVPAGAFGLVGTFGRDQQRSLELALALHPDTEQVFVIVRTPAEAPPYERYVRRALAAFEGRVKVRYLSDLPTADVIRTLTAAPARSIALYVQQTENTPGGRTDPRDELTLIQKSVSLPLYGGLDSYMGYGVVGGYLYSGEANGVIVGSLAWRMANGERPSGNAAQDATVPIFDARQLRRFQIAESQLPPGSVVVFREPAFWARYRRYGIAALLIFALQLGLIGMLLVQQRRRRRAERAARDSEERYRHVVEAQTDLIVRFLPDNTLTFVNDAYCRYRGKPANALLGTRIVEKASGAARQALQDHFDALSVPPHTGRFESDDVMPDGTQRWHEWITHASLGPDGRVIEFMATGRDITERRRAEDALRFSESRTSAILRGLPDLMFVMSRDGTYLDYHAKDPRDLWVPPEQFLGKTVFDVMPPELSAVFAPAIARADEAAEPVVVEYALPMPGGERFFEARIVGSQSGQVLSIVRDITEHKQAAARLRVSEDRYALATAAGGVGVWDWNIETDRLYIDPAVLSILGMGDQANRRVDWKRLVHPQDHEPTRAAAYAYLEGRANAYDMELRMLHKDGSLRWFHTRGSLVRRPDGSVYRMVGTFTDVTERRHAETLLREQEAVLRASHQEIGDLAGRLIFGQETERKRLARELHDDLSQKIALLSIDLDQLRQDAPDFATRLRRISAFTGDIATEVHQLSHQLHPFKLEALGLVAAIQSVCSDVSAQSGLAIEFQHDRVPARIHPDVTLCLFRIVQEGIRNVIKHSRAKRVWVYLGMSDPDLALQIADSGVGFDLAKHERSGLGLVSMRERVNFLGGELAIHSMPGSGTRIGVRVPLEPRHVELASADVQRLPGEESPRAEQRRLPTEEPLPTLDHRVREHLPAESA